MRALALLHGLWELIGAVGIDLGENEARLVVFLWQDHAGENRVSIGAALARMAIDENEFRQVVNRLIILGIIDTEDDSILKIDQIFLVV
jgi:hypothetical protein